MTDIEQKALALVNEVSLRHVYDLGICYYDELEKALCRAIEQHEAFRQEVSDAAAYVAPLVERWVGNNTDVGRRVADRLRPFIIAKPDPLVEAWDYMVESGRCDSDALRAAIEKRGGKIVWGEKQ